MDILHAGSLLYSVENGWCYGNGQGLGTYVLQGDFGESAKNEINNKKYFITENISNLPIEMGKQIIQGISIDFGQGSYQSS